MPKKNFHVGIMHGHSKDYKELKSYIQEAGFTPRVLIEEYSANTIFDNFRDLVWWHLHCTIILLTKDDKMFSGKYRARQNVIFELGYCFGAFDSLSDNARYSSKEAIIIISERGVQLFADIHGVTRIDFKCGKLCDKKDFIMAAIQRTYLKAKKFYKEDNL